jgi:hypothetical protein
LSCSCSARCSACSLALLLKYSSAQARMCVTCVTTQQQQQHGERLYCAWQGRFIQQHTAYAADAVAHAVDYILPLDVCS